MPETNETIKPTWVGVWRVYAEAYPKPAAVSELARMARLADRSNRLARYVEILEQQLGEDGTAKALAEYNRGQK
jgi:hypothetical protein